MTCLPCPLLHAQPLLPAPETISLLGDSLHAPALADSVRARYERKLAEARRDSDQAPNDPSNIIWLGRRTAYLVSAVIERWRASGGEPDVGLDLPRWLEELGFDIRSLNAIMDVVPVSSFVWQWPRTFMDVGLRRLVDLGDVSEAQAAAITQAFATGEATPGTRMVTPAVIEIIAVRGG